MDSEECTVLMKMAHHARVLILSQEVAVVLLDLVISLPAALPIIGDFIFVIDNYRNPLISFANFLHICYYGYGMDSRQTPISLPQAPSSVASSSIPHPPTPNAPTELPNEIPNEVAPRFGPSASTNPKPNPPPPSPLSPRRIPSVVEGEDGPFPPNSPPTPPGNSATPLGLLSSHKSLLLLPPLVVATFLLSFFFAAHSRQPKTSSRAALPSPSLSLPISPISPTSHISPPSFQKSGGGFAGLIDSSSPSPRRSLDEGGPSPSEALAKEGPSSSPSNLGNLSDLPLSPPAESNYPSDLPLPPTTNPQSPNSQTPPSTEDNPRVSFDIAAQQNTFTPAQLEAHVGQIIIIYITATDHAYDFAIPDLGIRKVVKQGQKSSVEFQATSFGQYIFECKENCEGAATARGLLTINPAPAI
jgi:hypothetical protein